MTTETPILKLSPLYSHLRRWGLRLRLVESLSWGPWGGVVGLLLGLLLALAARLWPLMMSRQVLDLAGLSMLAGVAVGLAIAWLRPRGSLHLARTFDRRLGLAERLVTAVEIGTGRLQAVPVMARVQLADTLDIARHTDHRALLPLRVSRPALIVLLVLMAGLATLLWLPNPQEDVLLQRAAVRAAIEEQIEDLETVKEEVAQADGLTEEERQALLEAIEEAIAGLEEGKATPEEAVAALSEAEQALAKLQDPGAAKVQAGLERAAEGMKDSALTEEIAEALDKGDYQAAAEALAKYGTEEGQKLTDEEALELARELAEAAEALAEADPELAEKLAEAAEAIESGDISEAQEAIREAAAQMGEAGERVERQEAVEGVLAELQEGREGIAQAGGTGQQAGGGQQAQPGHSEDAGSGSPYDEEYDPERIDEEGIGVDVGREGDEGVTMGDVSVPAPDGGSTSVPYRDVYPDYSEQAGAALEGSYIPLGMKQYVRDYFSSLEP